MGNAGISVESTFQIRIAIGIRYDDVRIVADIFEFICWILLMISFGSMERSPEVHRIEHKLAITLNENSELRVDENTENREHPINLWNTCDNV